jgi:hypothetical protein
MTARTSMHALIALALLALALAAAGCGSDEEGKPIPAATATALNAELDNVQSRIDNGTAGACKDILEGPRGPNDDRVQQVIDNMPNDVDSDVRAALQDSFDQLWDLVQGKCDDLAQEQESDQPAETDTTPTDTDTTPTETTTTDTATTETTPPATEELPPEGDGDNGGGVPGNGDENGNGNGVGGGISPDDTEPGGGG